MYVCNRAWYACNIFITVRNISEVFFCLLISSNSVLFWIKCIHFTTVSPQFPHTSKHAVVVPFKFHQFGNSKFIYLSSVFMYRHNFTACFCNFCGTRGKSSFFHFIYETLDIHAFRDLSLYKLQRCAWGMLYCLWVHGLSNVSFVIWIVDVKF